MGAAVAQTQSRRRLMTRAAGVVGFEAFPLKSAKAALNASTKAGIGYGQQSSAPGKFYEYPGDPRKIGVGSQVLSAKPS